MALGDVFIRPQTLDRRNEAEEWRLADEYAELASRLIQDALNDGPALQKVGSAFQSCANELRRELQNQIENASEKVLECFAPILETIEERLKIGNNGTSIEELVEAVAALIELTSDALESLGTDQLAQKLNDLGNVVENDIGLTPGRLCDFLKQCVDRAVDDLTSDYLAGIQTPEAKNNFLIGSRLSSLKATMVEQADVFSFDREKLIGDLAAELKRRKWDEHLQRISNITSEFGSGVSKLSTFLAPLSIGANAASKNALNDPMSWYASWFFDEVTGVADRFALQDEPFFNQMSFKRKTLSPEFMEHWAHLTSATADIAEAVLHGIAMERGNRLSHLFNLIHQGGYGVFTLAAYGHENEDWLDAFKVIEHPSFKALTPLVPTLVGSFERYPGSFGAWVLSTLVSDLQDMIANAGLTSKIREITLSFLTLLNADAEKQPDSINHEKVDGFASLFAIFGAWLAAHTIRKRDLYFIPLDSGKGKFAFHLILSIVIVFGMEVSGWLLGGAIAKKFASSFWETKNWILSVLLSPVSYLAAWYGAWEGDTDEGKAGLEITTGAGGNVIYSPVRFSGYPDRSNSPYKLPYEKGKLELCPQSHLGIFSHNFHTNQIFAVDFALDFDREVSAMRGGTVEYYKDEIPDHSTERENYIVIRHDDPTEDKLPDPIHDVREAGKLVTTKAWYLHGRRSGVRHAFAARGIPQDYIIGLKVKQGNVVMFSDDTGMSAYNHLHVHVGTDNCIGHVRTIPFVYQDVEKDGVPKHSHYYVSDNEKTGEIREIVLYQPDYHGSEVIRKNIRVVCGRRIRRRIQNSGPDFVTIDRFAKDEDDIYKGCFVKVWFVGFSQTKRITAYDGGNKKATIAGTWNPQPPAGSDFEIICLTRDSGSNHVFLDPRASSKDDAYKNAHIYIWPHNASEDKVYYYKKITKYDGDSKKATIEGEWNPPPPAGSEFRIGAPPYASANGFNKTFGYWANNDNSNNAVNFSDSRVPYKYTAVGKYHPEAHTGKVVGGGNIGTNFIEIDPGASAVDEAYNRRHIVITKSTEPLAAHQGVARGGGLLGGDFIELENTANPANGTYDGWHIIIMRSITRIQFKRIKRYPGGGNRRAVIEGVWDVALNTGAGGDRYLLAAPIIQYKRIRNYTGAGRRVEIEGTWDMTLATGINNGNQYKIGGTQYFHHQGVVHGGGGAGEDFVILEPGRTLLEHEVVGKKIIFHRIGEQDFIDAKMIKKYEAATRKATIDGKFEQSLILVDPESGAPLEYTILGRQAYLAHDDVHGEYSPRNFDGGNEPYTYLTFKREWPK